MKSTMLKWMLVITVISTASTNAKALPPVALDCTIRGAGNYINSNGEHGSMEIDPQTFQVHVGGRLSGNILVEHYGESTPPEPPIGAFAIPWRVDGRAPNPGDPFILQLSSVDRSYGVLTVNGGQIAQIVIREEFMDYTITANLTGSMRCRARNSDLAPDRP